MPSDRSSSSSVEDARPYARPKPMSYVEATGADDEFAIKLQRRQLRLYVEPGEASPEELQQNQPKDTSNMANVNAELRQKYSVVYRDVFLENVMLPRAMASKQNESLNLVVLFCLYTFGRFLKNKWLVLFELINSLL